MTDRQRLPGIQLNKMARDFVDRVTKRMVKDGYPVELTEKRGFRRDFVPTDYIRFSADSFFEDVSMALIEGWRSKGALIHLMAIALDEIELTALIESAKALC